MVEERKIFYTTADGSKVYNEGQRKLDVCTFDGQQRRSMTFQVAKSKKGSGISESTGEEREQACFLIKIAVEKTCPASRTSEPMRKYGGDRKTGVYVLDLMVAHPQMSNDRSTVPHFHKTKIAFTTPVSPIETQLRKVVPELCVNDVPERVAEVEMSSANPVRGDPLPDWLQPFDENLVDDEEQRVARVEVYGGHTG